MASRENGIGKLWGQRLTPQVYQLHAGPTFWKQKADELRRAAVLLANQNETDLAAVRTGGAREPGAPLVFNQFVLLAAFCLENLFKGLLVTRQPELVSSGKVKGLLSSHNLVELARRLDIALSPEERRFCVLAQSASVYWGRYPISNTADVSASYSISVPDALVAFESLADRLASLYKVRRVRRQGPEEGVPN